MNQSAKEAERIIEENLDYFDETLGKIWAATVESEELGRIGWAIGWEKEDVYETLLHLEGDLDYLIQKELGDIYEDGVTPYFEATTPRLVDFTKFVRDLSPDSVRELWDERLVYESYF